MAINITRVTNGDIIEADESWRINCMEFADHTKLTVGQNFRTVEDKSSPQYVTSESIFSLGEKQLYYPKESFVEMNGPEVSDSTGLMIGGKAVPIAQIAADEGIRVRGKNFVVTNIEPAERWEGCARKVTAYESTPDGKIKQPGLTIQFQQAAPHSNPGFAEPDAAPETRYIHEVKVVNNVFRPKS